MKLSAFVIGLAILMAGQTDVQPTNSFPNPYQTVAGWAKLPEGRMWGSTSGVGVDRDGTTIWVAERCGANTCLNSTLDPILKFDANGTLVKSFGAGTMVFPHGLTVDRDGNIWVTDGQDNAPVPARGEGGARGGRGNGPIGPRPGATKGNQVFKFSPDGKLLMTLGKPGGGADPDYFYQPNDVLVAPDGSIFVSEGHGAGNNRLFKFSKDGKLMPGCTYEKDS